MSKVLSKMAVDLSILKSRGGESSVQPELATGNQVSRFDAAETSDFQIKPPAKAPQTPNNTQHSFESNALDLQAAPHHRNPSGICCFRKCCTRQFGGILLTLGCAVCFNGITFFSRRLFQRPGFQAPFFTAFIASSWLVLCFPIYVIVRFVVEKGDLSFRNAFSENVRLLRQDCLQMSTYRAVGAFAVLILLWVLTYYVYLRGVDAMETPDVAALFASNSNFVYVMSWILLQRRFISTRIVSFIISMTGIMILTYKDSGFPSHIWGCVLILLSNAFCACYRVVFAKLFGQCSSGQLSLCLSFLGALQTVTLWPVWLLLYATGTEAIRWNSIPWSSIFIISFFALGVNLTLAFGHLLVNTMFVRSGFLVAVATAIASEAIFNPAFALDNIQIATYALITVGFLLNALSQKQLKMLSDRFCCCKGDDFHKDRSSLRQHAQKSSHTFT